MSSAQEIEYIGIGVLAFLVFYVGSREISAYSKFKYFIDRLNRFEASPVLPTPNLDEFNPFIIT